MNTCDECGELVEETSIKLTQDKNYKIKWICNNCLLVKDHEQRSKNEKHGMCYQNYN